MYTASVNNAAPVSIAIQPGGITLDDQPYDWDISTTGDGRFHILKNDRSFSVDVILVDAATKTVRLKINGREYAVQVKDRFDLLLEKMGMSSAVGSQINQLKAPMPGLIVGVSLQPGDVVQKGETVLILEAMKMENALKAPGDGTVKAINVQKGDRVEKGQILIEF